MAQVVTQTLLCLALAAQETLLSREIGERILLTDLESGGHVTEGTHIGSVTGHIVHIDIHGLEILHCRASFLAAGVVGDDLLISLDGLLGAVAIEIEQAQLQSSLASQRMEWIFLLQLREGSRSTILVLQHDVRATHLEKCGRRVGRLGVFAHYALHDRDLSLIILL